MRIIGGNKTIIEKHPYHVSLRYKEQVIFCGGAIISSRHIVTAAHCLLHVNYTSVYTGSDDSHQGDRHRIKNYWIHEEWVFNQNSLTLNDIGLIEVCVFVSLCHICDIYYIFD